MEDQEATGARAKLPSLPARSPEGHKGSFGRILVIAGSRRFSGAGFLAAESALRSGAGLVTLATATSAAKLGACAPSVIVEALPETVDGEIAFPALHPLRSLAARHDLVVFGPGLALEATENLRSLMRHLFSDPPFERVLLDAAALRVHRAEDLGDLLAAASLQALLTPHPGEAAALLGTTAAAVQADRSRAAETLSNQTGAVVVLKGAGSLVGGARSLVKVEGGHDGLATAGSGDVLCGIIAGLWGRGMNAFDAAHLGATLHAEVADRLRPQTGRSGLTAVDLLAGISSWFGDRES